ncbi:aspartate racemase [candidate division BRC1 bacterium SM23_51]|nr:MAG: aspartate racemase [candidate division BRC1 bacterium SM23_51]
MTKHIGIVACSGEGAALCYVTICIEGPALLGKYAHPEITMHSHSFDEYLRYIETGDWDRVAELMLSSEAKVATAGADFAICPDNTIHEAFDRVVERSSLPWLHIAEEVATEAARQGYGRLGVLGTRYLMEGPVYREKLAAKGIEHAIPNADERERINRIIFDELVNGRFTAESRAYFSGTIDRLKNEGCDAVVLGCTEIPLLVSQEDSPLPTLDSTRILARAALKRATA